MNDLLNYPGFSITAVIISTVIFYFIYYYLSTSELPVKYCSKITHPVQREIMLFLTKKFLGFLILGLIPGMLYYYLLQPDYDKFGLTFNHFQNNLFPIFALIVLITVILYINQKVNQQNNSVQINLSEWNVFIFLINTTGWIMYLIGYEFLFRGILLLECYNNFGLWPAIAVNVSIYSAIHMVYGKAQAFGALIFGGIASYLMITRGTLFIPIMMHVSLSLISDYFSIRYNENLSFIRQKSFKL